MREQAIARFRREGDARLWAQSIAKLHADHGFTTLRWEVEHKSRSPLPWCVFERSPAPDWAAMARAEECLRAEKKKPVHDDFDRSYGPQAAYWRGRDA